MYEIRKVETDMELLEKVLFKENLNNVYKQVYRNKGANWVDVITVDELFTYIKEHTMANKKSKVQTTTSKKSLYTKGKWKNVKIRNT